MQMAYRLKEELDMYVRLGYVCKTEEEATITTKGKSLIMLNVHLVFVYALS